MAQNLAAKLKNLSRESKKRDDREAAMQDIEKLDFSIVLKELLLTMLYLGEGFKKIRSAVALGNSDPRILGAFVKLLRDIYKVADFRLRCYLYLRADQNPEKEKRFWSKVLKISATQFRKSQVDKRTLGKKTWKGYHGVCAVYCYDARIEKRLTVLQEVLLEKLLMGV
ncbi:MAG: hypothetical protein Q7K39_03895 [Candidatus Magasanikbacteria bacterium]|nr:hypothetical protein [Candidatus Magasanikbacteria bacterium]